MEHLALFSVTLNQAIGVGFLGIPYAFQNSGIIYSFIVLLFCSYSSYYIGTLTIELIFKELEEIKKPLTQQTINHLVDFFGPVQSYIFTMFLGLFIFGMLVAYSSVFSASLTANLPLPYLGTCDIYTDEGCLVNYRIYLTLFTIIVFVLTIIGVKEQKSFQIVLSLFRFLLIGALVIIAAIRIVSGEETSEITLINWENADLCYTVMIFAVVYQQNLPSIAEISIEKIVYVPWRVTIAFLVCYGLVGVILSISFVNVQRMCNLNYMYLDGIVGNIFKSFVLLCPAVDVLATAPMSSITLTHNIHNLVGKKVNLVVIQCIITGLVYIYSFFLYNLV